jgi:RNA polymerase sigma-70 factor, ECF subfamily
MRFGPDHGQQELRLDFGEYLDGLYGYAMTLSHKSTEAEDLVQETCLRALRAIDGLRPQGNVKSWLLTILRTLWLNQVRRRTAPDLIEPGAVQDPHAVYAHATEQEQMRAAIQLLPLEFREIILLREYEELSYQEIAAVLNCPSGSVATRLARARSKLRELLPAEFLGAMIEY